MDKNPHTDFRLEYIKTRKTRIKINETSNVIVP